MWMMDWGVIREVRARAGEVGADDARLEGLGEVGDDALRGGTERRACLGDFLQEDGGFVEMICRDVFGAL